MRKKNNKEVDVQGLTSNNRKRKLRCCFCGVEINEYIGHNPWPLRTNGRCCSYCNNHYVVPSRERLRKIQQMYQSAK